MPNSEDEAPECEHAATTPAGLIRCVDEPSCDFEDRILKLARIDEAEQAKLDGIFSYNVMDMIGCTTSEARKCLVDLKKRRKEEKKKKEKKREEAKRRTGNFRMNRVAATNFERSEK